MGTFLTIHTSVNNALQLVVELIDFFKTGKISASLIGATNMTGEHTLRIITINLLPWMKRLLRSNPEPLSLIQEYPWCLALRKLIQEDYSFRALLVIDGESVRLNPSIAKEDIAKIQKACATGYNPPRMP